MILDVELRHKEVVSKDNSGDERKSYRLKDLNISYINKEGLVDYLEIPLSYDRDGYIWEYCNSRLDKPNEKFKSWDDKPVKRTNTSRLNKYRIGEIIMRQDPAVIAPILEFNIPKKYIIDIETEITDGFPQPEQANNKVTAIGIANCSDKKITVFAIRPLDVGQVDSIDKSINEHFKKFGDTWQFKFVCFESEYDMLYSFFHKAIHVMPCITGWNVMGFDWMYLINRAEKLKINPAASSSTGVLLGKNRLPQHRLIVDYLDIVKKWDRVIKIKESMRLDYIAEQATGLAKIKYPGTLKDLYDKDYTKFIFYNAVDAILVHYIDQKLNTMTTFFKLAQVAQVETNKAFSPIWVMEALMLREFMSRGKVFVDVEKDAEQQHFEGAYVKEPITGLHKWVTCFDFASLYPNTMMQFNISPESFLGKNIETTDSTQIVAASGSTFDNKSDSVLRTILKDLYARRKGTKQKMLAINKEVDFLQKKIK